MSSKRSLWQMTLGAFRDDIESRSMPGCGAAAAASAAIGLALVLKGLRFSGQQLAPHRDELIGRADLLADRLAGYADDDVSAFKDYLAALKKTGAENRDDALEQASERITRIPLETAHVCIEGLELTHEALALTKTSIQSDTRAGARLLHAGLCMVLLNVDANVHHLTDAEERERMVSERETLRSRADQLLEAV